MKKLFITLMVLSVTPLMACPNLSGQFACFDEMAGNYTLEVSQKGSGKNTVYTVKDYDGVEVSRADGVWRNTSEDGFKGKERTFCSGNSVKFEMVGSIDGTGKVIVRADVKLDNRGDLVNSASITIGGQQIPSDTQVCTRF